MVLVFCLMPFGIFDTQGADTQLVVAIYLLIAGSTEWLLSAAWSRRLLLSAAAILFLVRMTVIADNWRQANLIYAAQLSVIDQISYGSKMASAVPAPETQYPRSPLTFPNLAHLPNMAVLRKDALVNSLYAKKGQEVIDLKIATADLPLGGYDQLFSGPKRPQRIGVSRESLHEVKYAWLVTTSW